MFFQISGKLSPQTQDRFVCEYTGYWQLAAVGLLILFWATSDDVEFGRIIGQAI
jgi:hypothetical protein